MLADRKKHSCEKKTEALRLQPSNSCTLGVFADKGVVRGRAMTNEGEGRNLLSTYSSFCFHLNIQLSFRHLILRCKVESVALLNNLFHPNKMTISLLEVKTLKILCMINTIFI